MHHTTPKGAWPAHWKDTVHEEDGGNDKSGSRPQVGTGIYTDEITALMAKDGTTTAWDDVSGNEQAAGSRQQAAGSRQQATGSRQ